MNRDTILKMMIEKRGDKLRAIDRQFIALVSDNEYSDTTVLQWLDLKSDYKLELIRAGIIKK